MVFRKLSRKSIEPLGLSILLFCIVINLVLGFVKGSSTAWCNGKQLAWKDDIPNDLLKWETADPKSVSVNSYYDPNASGTTDITKNVTLENTIMRIKFSGSITISNSTASSSTESGVMYYYLTYGSYNRDLVYTVNVKGNKTVQFESSEISIVASTPDYKVEIYAAGYKYGRITYNVSTSIQYII